MYQRSRTHGAWLDCSKQFAIHQAMVAYRGTGLAQGNDFSMRGRIGIGEIAVPATTSDFAITNDHRTDRDFAGVKGPLSSAESFLHEDFVVVSRRLLLVHRYSFLVEG